MNSKNIVVFIIIINAKLIHMHKKKMSCSSKNLCVVTKFQILLYSYILTLQKYIIRFLN